MRPRPTSRRWRVHRADDEHPPSSHLDSASLSVACKRGVADWKRVREMNKNGMRVATMVLGLIGATAVNAATDWSTQDYDLYPGDFDGDGKTDLLYVAKDASKASGIARSDGTGPNLGL